MREDMGETQNNAQQEGVYYEELEEILTKMKAPVHLRSAIIALYEQVKSGRSDEVEEPVPPKKTPPMMSMH
jgi:hypothetical protein